VKAGRQHHQEEVRAFLQNHFGIAQWNFSLPGGRGHETYFARGDGQTYFIKLAGDAARYQAMAVLGVTPPVLAVGRLPDGVSILVQPYVEGRMPSRKDFHAYLDQFAMTIHQTHHNPAVQDALPKATVDSYAEAGMGALNHIRRRWEHLRAHVPNVSGFVDDNLAQLTEQVQSFEGAGLVASHNDICNGNWLVTPEEQVYLLDLEGMSLDDPALDIGAILWWYYPPELRQRFLAIVGYAGDTVFQFRMRVRMAMHCLHIILPRERSFDRFEPGSFVKALADFRAIIAGEENPQGYED